MPETSRYQTYVEDEPEEAPGSSGGGEVGRQEFSSSEQPFQDSKGVFHDEDVYPQSEEEIPPPQPPVPIGNQTHSIKRVKINPSPLESAVEQASHWPDPGPQTDEEYRPGDQTEQRLNRAPPQHIPSSTYIDRTGTVRTYFDDPTRPLTRGLERRPSPERLIIRDRGRGPILRARSRSASHDREDNYGFTGPLAPHNDRYWEGYSDEWNRSPPRVQRDIPRPSRPVVINRLYNASSSDGVQSRPRGRERRDSFASSPQIVINNRLFYEDESEGSPDSDYSTRSRSPSGGRSHGHRVGGRDRRIPESQLQRAKLEAGVSNLRAQLERERLKGSRTLLERPELSRPSTDSIRATPHHLPTSTSRWQYEPSRRLHQSRRPEATTIGDDTPAELTFEKVEKEGLSISLELRTHETEPGLPKQKVILDPTGPEAMAWKQPKTDLPVAKSTCELLTIRALEYAMDGDGSGKTTLVCPGGPMKDSDYTSAQLRWLHIQRNESAFLVLRSLVLNCPYISHGLTSVALTLLEDVERRFSKTSENGAYIEPGTVLRSVGKYRQVNKNERRAPELAYFLSSPYINLQKSSAKGAHSDGYGAKTLLQSLYGYDVEDGTAKQIVQKMTSGRIKELLHVNQTWYLLIGPSILVTMSDMSIQQMRGSAVHVDVRSFDDGGLLSICLYDNTSRCYNSVVDLDYTYVDLLRHCVSLVTGSTDQALDYELLDLENETLTSAKWLRLISSPTTNRLTFYLRDIEAELRAQSNADVEVMRNRESRPNTWEYSSRTRERAMNTEYNRINHLPTQPWISYTPPVSASYEEPLEVQNRVRQPFVTRKGSAVYSSTRYYPQRQSSDDLAKLSRSSTSSSPSSSSVSRGRKRVRSPTPQAAAQQIEHEDPASVVSHVTSEGELWVNYHQKDEPTRVPSLDHEAQIFEGPKSFLKSQQTELAANQDATNSNSEFELEKRSIPSVERSNWSVVLYTGNPFSPSQVEPRELNMMNTKSYKDTRFLQGEGLQTRRAPYLAPIRRSSISFSSNGGEGVELNTEDGSKISGRVRDLTKSQDYEYLPYRSNEIYRHSTREPHYFPEQGMNKWPSDNRHVYIPSNHWQHRDGNFGTRSARSEIAGDLRQRNYEDYVYPSQWDARTVGPIAMGQHDGALEFHGRGIKWTDRVAMSENVLNEFPSQEKRDGAIYTLDDGSDMDGQITYSSNTVLDNGIIIEGSLLGNHGPSGENGGRKSTDHGLGSNSEDFENDKPDRRLPSQPLMRDRQCPRSLSGNRRTKNVQFADDYDNRYSSVRRDVPSSYDSGPINEGRPCSSAGKTSKILADTLSVPFLEWPLKRETDQRDKETTEKSIIRILSSINKKLQTGDYSSLYSRSFRCTLQDLKKRHPLLFAEEKVEEIGISPASSQKVAAREDTSGKVSTTSDGDGPSTTTQHANYAGMMLHSLINEKGVHSIPRVQEIEAVTKELRLMKRLQDVSHEILSYFIPKEGTPLSHHISVRFWGAVDAVFRQLAWEATDAIVAYPGQKLFAIRNYESTMNGKKKFDSQITDSWTDCRCCSNGKAYGTAHEALSHLHSHRDCLFNAYNERPWDDPCYVWIRVAWDGAVQAPRIQKDVLVKTEGFINTLLGLKEQIAELHGLVATAWNTRADGKRNKARPPLPASVVEALTQIVTFYVILAQDLSLENRIQSTIGKSVSDSQIRYLYAKQREFEMGANEASLRAGTLLQDAKKDIILLGSTSHDIRSLGVEAVGPEFLTMALIINTQNRKVMPESLVPSTISSAADYIHVYRSYIARLSFRASKRPKRRLFLDIDALQEELVAAATIDQSQSRLLENFVKLISPGSFRVTNKTRIGIFRTEKSLAHKQQRRLRARIQDIQDLIDKADHLKVRVKQTIEIIEEDHGKAIRVFTIVTLFFLPLSFVSSFMGMNTADIRDMSHSQSIFWSTSVPVTAVVLFAAVVYGYYWDEIGDWLTEKVRATRRPVWSERTKKQQGPAPIIGRAMNLPSRRTHDSLGF